MMQGFRKRVIIVTGIPGVGKTTVLNKAVDLVKEEFPVEIVNYGSIMLETAVSSGFVENRDQMRLLPPEEQRTIQKLAAEAITKKAEQGKVLIVDTHLLINTSDGYLPGLPSWVVSPIDPDVIVLVEAEPESILKRRSKDASSRVRDTESMLEMTTQQSLCRAAAVACSTLTGATVAIIKNKEDMIEKTAEDLAYIFKEALD